MKGKKVAGAPPEPAKKSVMKNILREPKIIAWKKTVAGSGCRVKSIKPLALLTKRNGEFLFGLFCTDVRAPGGERLLPYLLVRGGACIIVPLVKNNKTNKCRYLMVRQRRIGNGHSSLEFPAGMLDRETGNPAGVAIRELREETGLCIRRKDLFPLWDKRLFSSPGLDDEAIYYYGCVVGLPDREFRALEGMHTGDTKEGESITVALLTREQAEKEATSGQVMLAMHLFERKHRKGRFYSRTI